jgi:hypothetical protein
MAEEKICFIVSPIGDPGTEVRQKADDFLEFIVQECDALSRHGYTVIRGDKINEPGRITTQVVRYINSADLVIVDVTGGNANVYYELALRDALGKPLITCAEIGTQLPFDTRDQRTIFYSMHSRLARQARVELGKQIDTVNSGNFVPENPIYEALKVIKLAESTDSGEQTLGLMLQKLDDVAGRMGALEQKVLQAAIFSTRPPPTAGFGIPVGGIISGQGGITSGVLSPFITPSVGEPTPSPDDPRRGAAASIIAKTKRTPTS